ncbi:MAG: TRAM domain-containing protein [candidate division WOR-3 bacterium]|nr:TRAM domain-containing protein [candidate division WOR-3 bacterium]MCX7836785.1 TRAM domain-containing protein [candidate division WOR-3 bacterium]MDW8113577.1 TRAM domain-containing protein [candidate division WOR-3 bacterium]
MFFKKERSILIDIKSLEDPRILNFLKLKIFDGNILVLENTLEISEKSLISENLEKLKALFGKKLKIIKGKFNKEKIYQLAKRDNSIILTTNPTLKDEEGKVTVITIDDIYSAVKPVFLAGSIITVKIMKKGKDADEGIGYLDGGIKVVVDGGARYVGKELECEVIGTMETQIGKVVFAKIKYKEIK